MNNSPTYPRMAVDIYHPCIHLFTNYWTGEQTADAAVQIKKGILGSADAPTAYNGSNGKAQIAVQTEFIVSEFSASSLEKALGLMDQRLDALFDAGLAVHFLLPVHQPPQTGWLGVDWEKLMEEWPRSTFDPYQPSVDEFTGGVQCPYDIIVDNFHVPVIKHLVETGRAEKLAVIYTMNEFAYPGDVLLDSAANWGDSSDWKLTRAQALVNTAQRNLEKCREAAAGSVPVGLKFTDMGSPYCGWTPFEDSQPDQLSNILNIMSKAGDILGFDMYFTSTDDFATASMERLSSFFHLFAPGFFEISESGRRCTGNQCQFVSGLRTSAQDILEATAYWSEAKGYNLFAWNASGSNEGCYSMITVNGDLCSGANEEMRGLWALAMRAIGETL